MENSSKALLIAAAILIVVLLVTISIKILSKPTDVIGQAQGVQDSMSTTSKDAIEHIQSPFDKTRRRRKFWRRYTINRWQFFRRFDSRRYNAR